MPDPAANNCLIWYGADTGNTLTRCPGFWRTRHPTSRKIENPPFKEAYFGKSGTRLTDEIADGIHIYTCFSRADLEKAYSEYLELFKSESDAGGRKPR